MNKIISHDTPLQERFILSPSQVILLYMSVIIIKRIAIIADVIWKYIWLVNHANYKLPMTREFCTKISHFRDVKGSFWIVEI